MCANTLWLFSSSTRNMAFGRDSRIVPSSTMASSFGLGSGVLLERWTLDTRSVERVPGHAQAQQGRGAMLAADVGATTGVTRGSPDPCDDPSNRRRRRTAIRRDGAGQRVAATSP